MGVDTVYNQKFNREEYEATRQTFLMSFRHNNPIKQFSRGEKIKFALGSEVMQLIEGRAKVVAYSEKGHERLLYLLSPGDLMGEIDFFVEHSPDIEIIGLTDIQMIAIPKEKFQEAFSSNPNLYHDLIISIIRKYQIIRSQLADTVFRDARGKIAALLLRLCSQEGLYHEERCELFYIKHHDLAAMIGCSRVTVSKVLQEFAHEGIMGIKKNKMIIFSEPLLRQQLLNGTRE